MEIEFFGYSNPTGRCHECPIPDNTTTHSCCDSFVHSSCNGSDLCDSYFYFCLRTIGDSRTTNGCWYPGSNVTFTNVDDAPFDINNISAVLGINNPLILPGLTMDFEVIYLTSYSLHMHCTYILPEILKLLGLAISPRCTPVIHHSMAASNNS